MNILMVGHSRSGKTSFMAGMYKYLGDSKEGYGVRAKDATQKKNLERMAAGLSQNRYPAGTDVQQKYNFALTVNGEDIIPFNWIDYRGGILLSDDPDEGDMDKFLKAIKQADALVVFLDGQKLADRSGRWLMEYDILLSCIENSLDVDHKSWFPISFVITKCDLLPAGTQFYGLERFNTLFSQIQASHKVGGTLIHSVINSESYFTPFLALAYCICGGAPIYIGKRVEAMQEAANRVQYHRPETVVGNIFAILEHGASRLAGAVDSSWQWESEYDLTEKAEHDYEKEAANLQVLESIAEDLKGKLEQWSKDDVIFLF